MNVSKIKHRRVVVGREFGTEFEIAVGLGAGERIAISSSRPAQGDKMKVPEDFFLNVRSSPIQAQPL